MWKNVVRGSGESQDTKKTALRTEGTPVGGQKKDYVPIEEDGGGRQRGGRKSRPN